MIAITRAVSSTIVGCELTHLEREPIDLVTARDQHRRYEDALRDAGISVTRAAPRDDLPDAVFVEDTALVLDEIAVMTRPGARRRRDEVASVREVLSRHRPLVSIEEPATLDGGDVLVLGRDVFVGLTARSSLAGVEQLRAILSPLGYVVRGVAVDGCLHLKSAVTRAGANTLVANPEWVDPASFPGWNVIPVDASEPRAGNVLWLGGGLTIVSDSFPNTNARLATASGSRIVPVPASELAKAEGGVTCCSLLISSSVVIRDDPVLQDPGNAGSR
jgi:dimethylargininase